MIVVRPPHTNMYVHVHVRVQTCAYMHVYMYCRCMSLYVTRSRKRGPFPQKSDCELDLSADSAKSVVHARENRLMLAHSVPKLQSFEYHTHAYLGFEISAFVSVL